MSNLLAAGLLPGAGVWAGTQEDLPAMNKYFAQRFPDMPTESFGNGPYALDANERIQWETMEEFPPYEDFADKGEAIWNKSFGNGKSFGSCLGDDPSKGASEVSVLGFNQRPYRVPVQVSRPSGAWSENQCSGS